MRRMSGSSKAKKLFANLEVLDGVKCWLSFHVCFALSFLCAYYQLMKDQASADQFLDSFSYVVLVEGISESARSFLIVSGFLQTLHFVNKYGEQPSWKEAATVVLKRVSTFMPIYFMLNAILIYGHHFVGQGPFWDLFIRLEN